MTDSTPDNTTPKPPELKEGEAKPEIKAADAEKPSAPEGAKAAPEGPKAAPEGPKAAPEGPKAAPEGPKAAPEGPKAAPEGPKAAPEGPKAAPEGAKAAPAGAKAAPAGAKAAAPAGAKAPAAPAAPPEPLKPGVFGSFLADHGINSERVADHAGGVECIIVDAADIQKAMKLLRSSDETKLNYLLTVSGVDQADAFESVYHLWSYNNNNELVVKVRLKKADVPEGQLPMVPSLARFWKAANWHERETYDLVGIRYLGHPYLRRILNTWDWDGYPLRRDYLQPIDALNDKAPGSFR